METQSITISKTRTIVQCAVISVLISIAIVILSNIDIHTFVQNILEWDSI